MPAKYRDCLGDVCAGELIVTIDRGPCLLLYPRPVWEEVEKKLIKLSSTNRQARRLKRFLIGHADDCQMDGQGRILIPPPLREFAHLDKRIALIGQGYKFEMWNEQRWYELRTEWLEDEAADASLPDDLESLEF